MGCLWGCLPRGWALPKGRGGPLQLPAQPGTILTRGTFRQPLAGVRSQGNQFIHHPRHVKEKGSLCGCRWGPPTRHPSSRQTANLPIGTLGRRCLNFHLPGGETEAQRWEDACSWSQRKLVVESGVEPGSVWSQGLWVCVCTCTCVDMCTFTCKRVYT